MPLYEFKCKTCDNVFEERRPMAEANSPATCPNGHSTTVRLLSAFASVGNGMAAMPAPPSGGSCCGGGCCS
ncbi:MAG: FmdB family zinc ribbon protein [Ilumatobacteraceae bacterium]